MANIDEKFGYKIFYFNDIDDISEKIESVENIFKIQKMLSDKDFAPEPYEIICCHDEESFQYAIKMENVKGKFINPPKSWIKSLIDYCEENGLDRNDWSIEKDCTPKNCIEKDGNIYLVDIDWKCCSFWMNNVLDEWELK